METIASLTKQLKKIQKETLVLTEVLMCAVSELDKTFINNKLIDKETSSKLAKITNVVEGANDRVRYITLGIDFRENKQTVLKKLYKKYVSLQKGADPAVVDIRDSLKKTQQEKLDLEIKIQNEYVNLNAISDWIKNPNRKPPSLAFTESNERQLAFLLQTYLK